MIIRKRILCFTLSSLIAGAALALSTSAQAGHAGAFLGGVFATKIVENMSRQTDAQEEQAQAAQYQAAAAARPAPSAQASPEARIKQLDKLAAGGYITPAEYKAKKKAILDSM
jgi:uncharacterized protein YdbL (DUF1318 family)